MSAEAKEFIVDDLRRQVADLLQHKSEAAALRRQLAQIDERAKARDLAQQARVEEMAAKLKLHAAVEAQLEAQVVRAENERLAAQRRLDGELDAHDVRDAMPSTAVASLERRDEEAERSASETAATSAVSVVAESLVSKTEVVEESAAAHLERQIEAAEARAAAAEARAEEAAGALADSEATASRDSSISACRLFSSMYRRLSSSSLAVSARRLPSASESSDTTSRPLAIPLYVT